MDDEDANSVADHGGIEGWFDHYASGRLCLK